MTFLKRKCLRDSLSNLRFLLHEEEKDKKKKSIILHKKISFISFPLWRALFFSRQKPKVPNN